MVVPVTASVQAGSLSPDRISAVETGDGDLEEPEEEAGDFTLAQAAEELALQSIESFPPGELLAPSPPPLLSSHASDVAPLLSAPPSPHPFPF